MQAGMVLWVAGMLTLLGSCGSDERKILDNREGQRSGTRLKLRWYDFDGEKLPAGLFDSERNEACTPTLWPDGQHYCTPKFEPPRAPIFRDASCTVQVAKIYSTCEAPPENALFAQEEQTCVYRSPFRSSFGKLVRGSRINLTEHYVKIDSRCLHVSGSDSDAYYELGELSPSELVALSAENPEGEGDLQLVYASSADGARIPLHGFDRVLDTACTLEPTRDAQAVSCIPEAKRTELYADPMCQQSKIAFPEGCAPSPFALVGSESCTAQLTLQTMHRIGAKTSAAPNYSELSGTCSEETLPGSYASYSVGEEVTAQSVPRMPIAKGGPRIQSVRFADGNVRLAGTLIDTNYEYECAPITLADGTIRCLPILPFHVAHYFTDAACQTSVALLYAYSPCEGIPIPPLAYLESYGCPNTHQVFEVGDRYTGAVYRDISGTCTRINDSASGAYYSLGPEIPLTSLAQGTLVTEP